jgi:hypothetical protein
MGNKIKNRVKIPIRIDKTLIRQGDGLTRSGNIKFIEFIHMDNKLHDEPKIGYGCIVDPQYGRSYTWLTTEIIEIINNNHFRTKNSEYKIE